MIEEATKNVTLITKLRFNLANFSLYPTSITPQPFLALFLILASLCHMTSYITDPKSYPFSIDLRGKASNSRLIMRRQSIQGPTLRKTHLQFSPLPTPKHLKLGVQGRRWESLTAVKDSEYSTTPHFIIFAFNSPMPWFQMCLLRITYTQCCLYNPSGNSVFLL